MRAMDYDQHETILFGPYWSDDFAMDWPYFYRLTWWMVVGLDV